ncbi:hypothetical protein O3M35_011600 [Rhynocoris fuscipes]|uniref:CUB domain-containing protein n=1 Tax=Rhynocoris fuscipes TaxID=488301 RepID=A0AAW1CVS7_9HEMI
MRTEAEVRSWECNKTIILTPEEPRATLTSPDFPRPYPDETVCLTLITAPPAFTILLEFEELVLENEPS